MRCVSVLAFKRHVSNILDKEIDNRRVSLRKCQRACVCVRERERVDTERGRVEKEEENEVSERQ